MIGQTISHYRILPKLGGGGTNCNLLGRYADPDIPILKEAKTEYAKLQ